MESRSRDASKDEELDVPTEGWKIGVQSVVLVTSWKRGSMVQHKDSNLNRHLLMSMMLMDRPSNTELFHKPADADLVLGPESIT
jgi:hypothetical protein